MCYFEPYLTHLGFGPPGAINMFISLRRLLVLCAGITVVSGCCPPLCWTLPPKPTPPASVYGGLPLPAGFGQPPDWQKCGSPGHFCGVMAPEPSPPSSPGISPPSGLYDCPITVSVTSNAPAIYITLDGSAPTTQSAYFPSPVTMTVWFSATVSAQSGQNGALVGAVSKVGYTCHRSQPPEPVACSISDDGPSNQLGPSEGIFISGHKDLAGKACIPGGEFGLCRRWFGQCATERTKQPVHFFLFDDTYTNRAGPTDFIYVNKDISGGENNVCMPDATPLGTCRKWFGTGFTDDARFVSCSLWDDSNNVAGPSDALFFPRPIPDGGSVCMPSRTPNPTCSRWFGRCQAY